MASNDLERDLTKASVGYLSKEDYKRKREEMESEKALAALMKMNGGGKAAAPAAAAAPASTDDSAEPPSEKKKKKKMKKTPSALSFGDELEEEAEAQSPGAEKIGGMAAARAKDEQQKAVQQEAAMREVLQQQQKARAEPLTLNYSFRSEVTQRELPSGVHKGTVTIKRGFTADEAAVAVRTDVESLGGKFAPNAVQGIREERDVVLICCCEGQNGGSYIIPGAVSLVELWMRRWVEGEPLFDDFKHGIVVTERRWLERQRHTYPYSHWRTYESREEYSLKEFIATRDKAQHSVLPERFAKKGS